MIDKEHGKCAGYCVELVREANDIERSGLNTDARMLTHAIFSVGAVIAQLLEEIASNGGQLIKLKSQSEKPEGGKQP